MSLWILICEGLVTIGLYMTVRILKNRIQFQWLLWHQNFVSAMWAPYLCKQVWSCAKLIPLPLTMFIKWSLPPRPWMGSVINHTVNSTSSSQTGMTTGRPSSPRHRQNQQLTNTVMILYVWTFPSILWFNLPIRAF